jgi:hypothetical protein
MAQHQLVDNTGLFFIGELEVNLQLIVSLRAVQVYVQVLLEAALIAVTHSATSFMDLALYAVMP